MLSNALDGPAGHAVPWPSLLVFLLCTLLAAGARAHPIGDYEAVIKAGDAAGLQAMLAAEDEPWPRSEQGQPLLHLAVSYFHAENETELVRVLIAAGAEIDARDAAGSTALYLAAAYRCLDCVRQLLAAGAFASARCAGGRTPLHVAHASAIPLLLAAGADSGAKDDEGNVPLHANWHAALLGPGVDVRNDYGFTPLHVAALRGDADGVRFLLARGANAALETTRDYRYVDGLLAAEWASEEIFEAGMRALDIARRRHDESKWSTGQYREAWELLDAATPRRSWFRR